MWNNTMQMHDIDFLIIGATKSATTWLQKSLQRDPAVAMPDPELHYFSREHHRGDGWYLDQFPQGSEDRLCGEKSNSYLEHKDAAGRVAASLPRTRLIAQLRNPVERAYSDYCMLYRRGEVGRNIENYLDPRVADGGRFLALGFYHRQLQAYLDRFPREQIHITFYENIAARPEAHLAEVRRFLGLPELQESLPKGKVKDKSTPILNPALRRALQPLKRYAAPFRQNAYFKLAHAALASEIRYAPLSDALRARLEDHYRRDAEDLGKLVGQDLTGWLGKAKRAEHASARSAGR